VARALRCQTERLSGIRVRVCSTAHNNPRLVQQGQSWARIGDALDHPPSDCRYRFEVYLQARDTRRPITNLLNIDRPAGAWTTDEAPRLNQIMQDLCEHGKTPEKLDGFGLKYRKGWIRRAPPPTQCSNKWYALLDRLINWRFIFTRNSSHHLWRPTDSKRLVQKYISHYLYRVAQLDLDREDDIRWDELIDARRVQWTGAKLRQKWLALRKTVHSPGATHRGVYMALFVPSLTTNTSKTWFNS
jgi:hypothetical protein